ncbi:MAG TPA: hypothetical protein VGG06_05010 [Thermoanaerobaculia bacterium]|jgi:hypothetical protein
MSCPDWSTLTARRDQDGEGELLWEHALEHLDGCGRCRAVAFAAEPALVFRRLPQLTAGAEEVRDMQRAVASMRRAQPLVVPRSRRRAGRFGALSGAQLRAAAAAVVTVGAALLYGLHDRSVMPETPAAGAPAAGAPAADTALPEALLAADAAAGELRFEIQVLRASSTGTLPSFLRYEDFELLAQASVSSSPGGDVSSPLGDRFTVSFRAGEVQPDGRLRLEGFQIRTRAPAVKGRQLEPQQVVNANLNLWLDRPLTWTLAQDSGAQEALVVAITCRQPSAQRPARR